MGVEVARGRRLFRGDLRMKKDHEVTDADLKEYNVVLWGDRSSNRLIDKALFVPGADPLDGITARPNVLAGATPGRRS